MKLENNRNVYKMDGFFLSKDNEKIRFKDYLVYAGKKPALFYKTESQMTEQEKQFDAKIWHYFDSKKDLMNYFYSDSIELNFYIKRLTGKNL